MKGNRTNKSGYPANHGKSKALIAAISVVCAAVLIIAALLFTKDALFLAAAQKKAEKNEFSAALELVEKSDDSRALSLAEYLRLRLEINEVYPALLSEFDSERVKDWSGRITLLSQQGDWLGGNSADFNALAQRLNQIAGCVDGYSEIRAQVLSMMDIFSEINRLHTKTADGKNTSFTVAEERVMIANWERQNLLLQQFAARIPNGERAYLLNYLIKEVMGECVDINALLDSVIQSGYSETDLVRFSGSGQKTFPDIQSSSNVSVNLLEKEKYETYMYKGICRELAESLGEFYIS